MDNIFSVKDLEQINSRGSSVEKALSQIEDFRKGFGYLPIESPANTQYGIMALDRRQTAEYAAKYENIADHVSILKFVPASGAATRMFKDLFAYVNDDKESPTVSKLLDNITEFAFYDRIKDHISENDPAGTVRAVLDYGAQLPKGLILFHRYENEVRTAVEEHLVEGAMYAASKGKVRIHFTVSPEHRKGFETIIASVREKYERRFGIKYEITFSQQDPGTDTIAVNPDNTPFREPDGSLLFRPAGHGALISNLGIIDAELVFIKNIDNVTTDRLKGDTVLYKKAMGGIMATLRERIYGYLKELDNGADERLLSEIAWFIETKIFYKLPEGFDSQSRTARTHVLRQVLNRPIRVCAMVRNEGEPGGGPFFARNTDGSFSLQIAEPSQIAPEKRHLLSKGTHFNPADLLCCLTDYQGKKFELAAFIDPATGFISEKSKDGKPLKALELPGLWNGSMSDWNTVFVEVPVSTFTPVKEVTDLLRDQHR